MLDEAGHTEWRKTGTVDTISELMLCHRNQPCLSPALSRGGFNLCHKYQSNGIKLNVLEYNIYIYIIYLFILMFEQSRKLNVREKDVAAKLGRSHQFPTFVPVQKWCMANWGCCSKENDVRAQAWHNLQKVYRDLGKSHRLPHVCTNSGNQCVFLTAFLLLEWWLIYWFLYVQCVLSPLSFCIAAKVIVYPLMGVYKQHIERLRNWIHQPVIMCEAASVWSSRFTGCQNGPAWKGGC